MRGRGVRVWTMVAVGALLVCAGCGGGDGGGLERSTLIGPSGGTIRSSDNNATVQVPDDAISAAQSFTTKEVTNPQPDPGLVANTAYRFGPEGWVFEAPVTITIGYNEADVPAGVDEATLKIARLQALGWVPVGTSAVNQANNTVSAQITGFSVFAVVGQAAAQATYAYDAQWGSQGPADGKFSGMGGIAYQGGLVYVSDMVPFLVERIQRFDANGVYLGRCLDFDTEGGAAGGIDVDASGDMYTSVVDVFAKVAAGCGLDFDRDAADLGLAVFHPTDVALDGAGNIFIAEMNQHRITELNAAGDPVRQIGSQGNGDGQFNFVGGVAVAPDGSIYASDHLGDRVLKFSNSGSFIGFFGETGDGNGQFHSPRGIDVDDDGDLYVADSVGNRVQKFTENGAFMAVFGSAGNGNGQFNFPTDVAVTPDGSTVYVMDSLNYRVQKFVEQ